MRSRRTLLVVDGYNLLLATPHYEHLIDVIDPHTLDTDPFVRARRALISDVATFAGTTYTPVVVFDGASNPDPERPVYRSAGVSIRFSEQNQSADELIEQIVTEARMAGRKVALVTSDRDIRAVAGQGPGRVERISSALLVKEIEIDAQATAAHIAAQSRRSKMTVEDRLDEATRQALWEIIKPRS